MQDQVKAEQEFRLFSRAIEISVDGIIMGDITGKITYINNSLLKMFGSTEKNDLQGRHILEFIAEKDRARAAQNSMECLKTGQSIASEYVALTKTGSEIPVEVTVAVIKDDEGKEIGFIDIVREIAERKKAEEALRKSEAKYQGLFTNMSNGLAFCEMIYDEKGKAVDFIYLQINDAFEAITGLKRESVVGKKVPEAIPGIKETNSELFEIYERVASTLRKEKIEIFFKPQSLWLSISVYSPMKGYFAAVFEDITNRKIGEQKLEEHNKKLEELVEKRTKELKDSERLAAIGELAGMVGHDLRNPLTAIKNAAYFLRKKDSASMSDKSNEVLTIIDRSVEYANKIVADLLEFSREMKLELEECSPKSLVDYVMLSIKLSRRIKILDHTESFPTIWVDANKMERVFINLIKNAIDAMPDGGVLEISSRQNGGNIEFIFSDTGMGMSGDTLGQVFTPLFTTKAQGMGFGLAICKKIVEAHHGKISVESTPNKGTTFIITLPVEQ